MFIDIAQHRDLLRCLIEVIKDALTNNDENDIGFVVKLATDSVINYLVKKSVSAADLISVHPVSLTSNKCELLSTLFASSWDETNDSASNKKLSYHILFQMLHNYGNNAAEVNSSAQAVDFEIDDLRLLSVIMLTQYAQRDDSSSSSHLHINEVEFDNEVRRIASAFKPYKVSASSGTDYSSIGLELKCDHHEEFIGSSMVDEQTPFEEGDAFAETESSTTKSSKRFVCEIRFIY